jgi:hypothetical protein
MASKRKQASNVRRNLVSFVSEPFELGVAKAAIASPQWRLSTREQQRPFVPKKRGRGR